MARKMPSRARRQGDLAPNTVVRGLSSRDLDKDLSEDQRMENNLRGVTTLVGGNRAVLGRRVTVQDVDRAVSRKQEKVRNLRKKRGY